MQNLHTQVYPMLNLFLKEEKSSRVSFEGKVFFFALVATKTIVFTTHTIRPLAMSFNARTVRRHVLEHPLKS